MSSISYTPTYSAAQVPVGHRKLLIVFGKPSTKVASPGFTALRRPTCSLRWFPGGQLVVDCSAGARLVKTSKRPDPESVAASSRKKWNSQVFPCDSGGKSKVTSVVISAVWPFLKIFPDVVLKSMAPVQTLYCERVVGFTIFGSVGKDCGRGAGTADVRATSAGKRKSFCGFILAE